MSLRYVLYGISDSGVRVGRVVNPSAHPREIWGRGFLTRNVKKKYPYRERKEEETEKKQNKKEGREKKGMELYPHFCINLREIYSRLRTHF